MSDLLCEMRTIVSSVRVCRMLGGTYTWVILHFLHQRLRPEDITRRLSTSARVALCQFLLRPLAGRFLSLRNSPHSECD